MRFSKTRESGYIELEAVLISEVTPRVLTRRMCTERPEAPKDQASVFIPALLQMFAGELCTSRGGDECAQRAVGSGQQAGENKVLAQISQPSARPHDTKDQRTDGGRLCE